MFMQKVCQDVNRLFYCSQRGISLIASVVISPIVYASKFGAEPESFLFQGLSLKTSLKCS